MGLENPESYWGLSKKYYKIIRTTINFGTASLSEIAQFGY